MTIDPVKIPQNVYVEDRIIGPITLRQIMIIMICAGVSYGIWAAMKSSGPVSTTMTTVAWMPTLIGALFAFVKINGISLFRIVLLMIEKLEKPSKRVWAPRQGIYINIVTKPPKKEAPKQEPDHTEKSTHIEELSRVLDEGPSEVPDAEEPHQELKPVNPNRIQAEDITQPVDDIAHAAEERMDTPSQFGQGIFRDITPPSHA